MNKRIAAIGVCCLLSSLVIAQTPISPQARPLAFTHVNVIDATGAPVRRDMTVILSRGRITSVEPSRAARIPAQSQVVDATGKYMMPGLWDMHVHWYDERFLGLFVANGVTGVRQMWGMPLHLDWRERIGKSALLGPRFAVASGIVDGPNPVWPGSILVSDESDARQAVSAIKRDGYEFVKVYNRLPREAYFAIAKAARAHGLTVVGHVPSSVTAAEASDAGQKTIEHLSGSLLGSSSAEEELRQRIIGLSKGGEASAGIDPGVRAALRDLNEKLLATYDASKATALFSRFVKNGTWQSPTLTVLRAMASLDDAKFTSDPRLKFMPRSLRDSWNPANDPRLASKTPDDYSLDRRTLRKQFQIVGAMHQAGVRLLAGTDVPNPFTFPGFSLHDELALLVEAGLTPMEALQTATINPAEYFGQRASSGTVEKGKIADVVVLDANPLENIANTKRIAAVVVAGRLLDRAELDAMLARAEKTASQQSVALTMAQTIETQGVAAAVRQYRELKAGQPDAYDFSENELSDLGYRLLAAKKVNEAIEIFKLNVEANPTSANTYDSLGEAHMVRGDKELAIQNYKRSLELDPRNENATQNLKKLGATK